jgi:hypothetical protein
MKDLQQTLRKRRQGATCADMAVALGRSAAAVDAKLKYFGKRFDKRSVNVPITPDRTVDKHH